MQPYIRISFFFALSSTYKADQSVKLEMATQYIEMLSIFIACIIQ